MCEPIKISIKDLFKAIEENFKYITLDGIKFSDDFIRIKAWKFKPVYNKKQECWYGAKKTKRELGYDWFDEDEEYLNELDNEIGYLMYNGSLFRVVEFGNVSEDECIFCRKNI